MTGIENVPRDKLALIKGVLADIDGTISDPGKLGADSSQCNHQGAVVKTLASQAMKDSGIGYIVQSGRKVQQQRSAESGVIDNHVDRNAKGEDRAAC